MQEDLEKLKHCKSIAIMGGTFDPIHNGHLVLAEAVLHRFKVDKVLFIPTGRPAHKAGKTITHNEHRYIMTVLATMNNDRFEVSRIEIDRKGDTFTIDTIEELRNILSEKVRMYFITGADAIGEIMKWKDPEKLLSLCDFVAAARPGYDKNLMLSHLLELRNQISAKIYFMEVTQLEISSSDIRNRVRTGLPIKYLLPGEVEDYIVKFGLYREIKEDALMLDFEVMKEKLQSALTVKRYVHTLGVIEEAVRLASVYGDKETVNKAKIAALLHDVAKEYPSDVMKRFCREYKVKIDCETAENTIHAFLGAEVAKREYKIEDSDILNAIRFHTTARADMSLLEKIIYVADYIEGGREKFEGLEAAARLAYLDLDRALKFILESTIDYIKEKGQVVHPYSMEALEYIKKNEEEKQ